MAIAALSMDGDLGERSARARRARALGVAVRFAAGHAILLGIGAGLIVAIGWSIPPHVERGGEMLAGARPVFTGLPPPPPPRSTPVPAPAPPTRPPPTPAT